MALPLPLGVLQVLGGLARGVRGRLCCLRVTDVDELYDAIRRSGVEEAAVGMPRLHPVRLREWGLRAGFLVDPDGTQLTLIEQAH